MIVELLVFGGMLGVWLGLLFVAVFIVEQAPKAKYSEVWRSIMAGLVGLGVSWQHRRHDRT